MVIRKPTAATSQDVFVVVLVIRLPTVQNNVRTLQNAHSARATTLQVIKDVPSTRTFSVSKNHLQKVTLYQLTLKQTFQMLKIVVPLMTLTQISLIPTSPPMHRPLLEDLLIMLLKQLQI